MSLNRCMHPRNIYKDNPPDFVELCKLYPEFKPFVQQRKSGKAFVSFRNPAAVRILSKCLLHKDFQLEIALPSNRLAPTVPSRLNYILWIQDLLGVTGTQGPEKHIVDIGTGSSCIYPLLGVRTDAKWKFTATEIDDVNYENATRNVEANGLKDCINVVKVEHKCDTLLKHLFKVDTDQFDCCMCNPPFFSDFDESQGKPDRPIANSSCHAGPVEAITDGGDLAFATKLFQESVDLKERLTWYTILLGKKSSFLAMKNLLSKHGSLFWTSYEFCQGKTIRWGIAWSFCPHLIDNSKIPQSQLKLAAKGSKKSKPIAFSTRDSYTLGTAHENLINYLVVLGVDTSEVSKNDDEILLQASAMKATWVHVRQRKRNHDGNSACFGPLQADSGSSVPILECGIKLTCDSAGCVNFEFRTASPSQKEALNGLIVYLKRLICKPDE